MGRLSATRGEQRWIGAAALAVLSGCYVGAPLLGDATDAGDEGGTAGSTGGSGSADGSSAGDTDDTGVPGQEGICGDGITQDDEECDQGAGNADTGACKSDCTDNVCG
ncbi:MAG: hypothetical protein KDK70_34690, partial [Myxococcales bacterium]|nr:hypothetical protein [Myxococcales bacterium]